MCVFVAQRFVCLGLGVSSVDCEEVGSSPVECFGGFLVVFCVLQL